MNGISHGLNVSGGMVAQELNPRRVPEVPAPQTVLLEVGITRVRTEEVGVVLVSEHDAGVTRVRTEEVGVVLVSEHDAGVTRVHVEGVET